MVQIVHGVAEHIGRYEGAAAFLAEHGYLVCGEDHLGHGKTAGQGEEGFFGEKDGWSMVIRDVAALRKLQGEKYPDQPYFLLGHSMGSFLTRTYLINYPSTLTGVILSGTGQESAPLVALGRWLAGVERRRLGHRGISPLVDKLSLGAYNRKFAPNRTGADWISRDEAQVDAYLADPYCQYQSTVSMFEAMMGGLQYIAKRENLARMDPSTPVYFFSGDQDPVGAVNLHYGDKYNDLEYNNILVPACAQAGIAAFTGDGTNPEVFTAAAAAIGANGGKGIPTVKPWDRDTLYAKLDAAKASGAKVFAMDIDAAGLPFLKGLNPPAGSKTVAELREIIEYVKVPFIIKGIMTVKGAQKALEAGAAGIVVSNHGGRVQDGVPATASVLPAIAQAVKGQMVVLVDGGIRTGVDVCKALALGADACILARPYVTAVYGGQAEGVKVLTDKLKGELQDTMAMCGVHSLSEISGDMIFRG